MNKVILLTVLLVIAGQFPAESSSILKSVAMKLRTKIDASSSFTDAFHFLDPARLPQIFDNLENGLARIANTIRDAAAAPVANISVNMQNVLTVLNSLALVTDPTLKLDFSGLVTKAVALQTSIMGALSSVSLNLENSLSAIKAAINLASIEAKAMTTNADNIFNRLKTLIDTVSNETMYRCALQNILPEMKGFTKVAGLATNCLDNMTTLFNTALAAEGAVGATWNTNFGKVLAAFNTCLAGANTVDLINALPAAKKTAMDKCLKAIVITPLDVSKPILALSNQVKAFGSTSATCVKTTLATAFMTGQTLIKAHISCLDGSQISKKIG